MRKLVGIYNRLYTFLTTTVSILSYLAIAFGFFRGLYFAYFDQDLVQFIWSVAMTMFAVYINLKNPKN